tara:strand:+ start:1759 stop:2748 length:990 start_codon:yes stop_codon:yes gene_type:complete
MNEVQWMVLTMIRKNFLTAGFIFTLLVSCGPDESTISSQAEDGNHVPTIALVMKSLANEFFVNMAAGAEEHNTENAEQYELIVNGIRNESDLAQQVALVDQMISSGVDAIVIAPADSRALVPALARASSAGIVVINIDNRLEPQVLAEYDLQIPFIGPSNLAGAKMVGEYALEDLASDSQVAILEGITSAFNSIERRTGFEQAVAAAGMQIVSMQSGEWDQTRAAQVTAGILSQYPELDVILAANDNMALGAASAVGVATLDHHITIAGFDNISAIRPLIESGTIIATVDQFGDQLAVFGIEYALEVLATGVVPEDRETPLELITVESL